jgi:hypothetical protein
MVPMIVIRISNICMRKRSTRNQGKENPLLQPRTPIQGIKKLHHNKNILIDRRRKEKKIWTPMDGWLKLRFLL